jgi:hypothetical protein
MSFRLDGRIGETMRMATNPQGMRALAETIAKLTRPAFGRRGFAGGAIIAEWSAIVGESLANHSAPEKVSYPPGGTTEGTLQLRIARGGLATELQHLEPVLIERINGYFGYRAVARLRFVHGPLPERASPKPPSTRPLTPEEEKKLADHLVAVEDPKLRHVLEDLGRSIIGRTTPGRDGSPGKTR